MAKNKINKRLIALAAFFCLAAFAWEFSFPGGTSAQEAGRDRKAAAVNSTPTPKPASTPKTKPTPTVAPTLKPSATPTPAPTATPTPLTPPPIQTLPGLQADIRAVLLRPQLQRGQIGIKVVSLDTGKTLFEQNAEKYFMPASNMKIFTVSTALARLSADFRFVTSVYAAAKPDSAGLVKGDLTVYGRGDPSIAASFNNGDYYKGLENLADKIMQAGVKRIEGDLVGDESYFTGEPLANTWEWDDLQWYYGAEISSLTVNDNALDLTARPGPTVGSYAVVTLSPAVPGIVVKNRVVTSAAGTKREIEVYKPLAQNVFEVSGKIPVSDEGKLGNLGSVAINRPALVFMTLLRQVLEQKGVVITGQTRVVGAKERAMIAVASSLPWIEIAKLESPPLGVIAAHTLKPSQNLYTELILRALGETLGEKSDPKKTSDQRGIGVVDKFLQEAEISDGSVIMWDGSGLSRHNLVTPASIIQIYLYMNKHRYKDVWRDALPVGGMDGTLKNRLKNSAAAGNVRAKTGTIDQVSSLSGYVTTAAGEKLAFSILSNGLPSQNLRQNTIDELVLLLANYNGKSN